MPRSERETRIILLRSSPCVTFLAKVRRAADGGGALTLGDAKRCLCPILRTWKEKVEADYSVKNYPYQMILKKLYLSSGQAINSCLSDDWLLPFTTYRWALVVRASNLFPFPLPRYAVSILSERASLDLASLIGSQQMSPNMLDK